LIAYIQFKFSSQEDVWKMVIQKAKLYIIKELTKATQKEAAITTTQYLIDDATNYFK